MAEGNGQVELDPRALRDIGGRFATGVTVITLRDGDQRHGMTANAFTSVSLRPPLVLYCIQKSASVFEAEQRTDTFAVNILAEDQRAVSDFFARTGRGADGDSMGGFRYRDAGKSGAPLLEGCIAWLDCRVWARYEGGDHIIVVGEVLDMALLEPEAPPLMFYGGAYRQVQPRS